MQEQTDWNDAYANGPYIAGASDYPPRWIKDAQAFRDELSQQGRAKLDVPYGDTPRQTYDLFSPEGSAKGLMIFVHGGYWLNFDCKSWSHFATGALARGWSVAMPSYDLCPDVSIAEITQQIARAVTSIAAAVPGPITLSGHSAGGHLVARMLAPDMLPGAVVDRIQMVAPISPVSDLRPLLNTDMNHSLKMDEAAASAESPALYPAPDTPVHVFVGEEERPAFLDQSHWLSKAWSIPETVVPGKHHFDVIDGLQDQDSDMVRCLTS